MFLHVDLPPFRLYFSETPRIYAFGQFVFAFPPTVNELAVDFDPKQANASETKARAIGDERSV